MSAANSNSGDRDLEALRRAQRSHEPSMEEILASIRSIIADDRENARMTRATRGVSPNAGPQIIYSKTDAPLAKNEAVKPEVVKNEAVRTDAAESPPTKLEPIKPETPVVAQALDAQRPAVEASASSVIWHEPAAATTDSLKDDRLEPPAKIDRGAKLKAELAALAFSRDETPGNLETNGAVNSLALPRTEALASITPAPGATEPRTLVGEPAAELSQNFPEDVKLAAGVAGLKAQVAPQLTRVTTRPMPWRASCPRQTTLRPVGLVLSSTASSSFFEGSVGRHVAFIVRNRDGGRFGVWRPF